MSRPSENAPVTVWLEGAPVGKGRARTFMDAGAIISKTPGRTKRIENAIKVKARIEMRGRPPLQGPLALVLRAGYAIPASWPKRKQEDAFTSDLRPTVRPDLDNVVKLWADALLKIAYADDAQLVEIHASKFYMRSPLTICLIAPLHLAAVENAARMNSLLAAAGRIT
jgi:Holliday junction resolvase RusA-like endonuclease